MTIKAVKDQKPAGRVEGITLRYKDVPNKTLQDALEVLDNFTQWGDPKDIFRFTKFKNTFDREWKKAGTWYRKLVEKHAEKEDQKRKSKITGEMEPVLDSKGVAVQKPKWAPDPETGKMDIVFKDKEAFERDVKVFHDHSFTVNVYRFRADDLVKAGLTPVQLRACAKIAEDMDPELLESEDDLDVENEELPADLAEILKD